MEARHDPARESTAAWGKKATFLQLESQNNPKKESEFSGDQIFHLS
jgi:hypothetical protein